jgi:competence protein ComEC
MKPDLISKLFDISGLQKRPMACGFLFFMAGIIYAHYTKSNFCNVLFIFGFSFFLFFVAMRLTKNSLSILLNLLVFTAGILSYINFNTLSPDHIYNYLDSPQRYSYVKGAVRSLPVYKWQKWNRRRCSFIFQIDAYKHEDAWLQARGLSQVSISDSQLMYDYGDSLLIYGNIKRLSRKSQNLSQGYAGYLGRKGIHATIDIRDDADIVVITKASTFSSKKNINHLRHKVQQRLRKRLPYPDNAMLSAMLVGRRENIPQYLERLFIETGTIHILSVSGLHVVILSGMLIFLLKGLRCNRKLLVSIVILFLAAYIVAAGERTPIIRASIMIAVYLVSTAADRDFDIYSALFFSGLIILFLNPMQVFDPGFQLSFACVFSIVYLTPKLENIFPADKADSYATKIKYMTRNLLRYSIKALSSSIAVFIGVWPIVAFHFKLISPVTITANLIVIPFLGVILLSGILLLIIPAAFSVLWYLFSNIIHVLFYVMLYIIGFLSDMPLAYFEISGLTPLFIGLYYTALYLVVRVWEAHKI